MKNNSRTKVEQAQNEKQYKRKGGRKTAKGKEKANQNFQMWLLINESLAFFIITKM